MGFKKDTSAVKSFLAGPIKSTGFYSMTISKAYDKKSQVPGSESLALHIDFVADNGQSAAADLWYQGKSGTSVDKNNKPLSALGMINDLQVLLDIDELKPSAGMVAIYDYDLRQDVEVKKRVYKDLIGQNIGAVFEVKSQPKNIQVNGEWKVDPSGATKNVHELRQFCCADTKASAAELLAGSEPVAIDRYVAILLDDAHIKKQASNQPNSPQNSQPKDPVNMNGASSDPDWDDENIPF